MCGQQSGGEGHRRIIAEHRMRHAGRMADAAPQPPASLRSKSCWLVPDRRGTLVKGTLNLNPAGNQRPLFRCCCALSALPRGPHAPDGLDGSTFYNSTPSPLTAARADVQPSYHPLTPLRSCISSDEILTVASQLSAWESTERKRCYVLSVAPSSRVATGDSHGYRQYR